MPQKQEIKNYKMPHTSGAKGSEIPRENNKKTWLLMNIHELQEDNTPRVHIINILLLPPPTNSNRSPPMHPQHFNYFITSTHHPWKKNVQWLLKIELVWNSCPRGPIRLCCNSLKATPTGSKARNHQCHQNN